MADDDDNKNNDQKIVEDAKEIGEDGRPDELDQNSSINKPSSPTKLSDIDLGNIDADKGVQKIEKKVKLPKIKLEVSGSGPGVEEPEMNYDDFVNDSDRLLNDTSDGMSYDDFIKKGKKLRDKISGKKRKPTRDKPGDTAQQTGADEDLEGEGGSGEELGDKKSSSEIPSDESGETTPTESGEGGDTEKGGEEKSETAAGKTGQSTGAAGGKSSHAPAESESMGDKTPQKSVGTSPDTAKPEQGADNKKSKDTDDKDSNSASENKKDSEKEKKKEDEKDSEDGRDEKQKPDQKTTKGSDPDSFQSLTPPDKKPNEPGSHEPETPQTEDQPAQGGQSEEEQQTPQEQPQQQQQAQQAEQNNAARLDQQRQLAAKQQARGRTGAGSGREPESRQLRKNLKKLDGVNKEINKLKKDNKKIKRGSRMLKAAKWTSNAVFSESVVIPILTESTADIVLFFRKEKRRINKVKKVMLEGDKRKIVRKVKRSKKNWKKRKQAIRTRQLREQQRAKQYQQAA